MNAEKKKVWICRIVRFLAGCLFAPIFLLSIFAFPLGTFAKQKEPQMTKTKTMGQIFTPQYLVSDILDEAGYTITNNILEKHVIDNSCGDGAFLEEILRRYCNAYLSVHKNKKHLSAQLSTYIHGIELDESAYKTCLKRLSAIAADFGLTGINWDIRNEDTLSVKDFDGKMDFVLGNPPYVRVHNLQGKTRQVKAFDFSTGGMTDLYLVFYEIGLRMLTDTGVLCYIAPSSWINSLAGHNMREYLRKSGGLRSFVDLGHFQPFKATAYTAIVTLTSGGAQNFSYKLYEGPNKIKFVEALRYDDVFFADALYLGTSREIYNFRKIKTSNTLNYVKVKNGFATLADDVFIADEFPFDKYVIRVIKASTGKWRKGFFPYDTNGKPLPSKKIFADRKITSYLEKHKELLLKGMSQKEQEDWYLYGRTQALKDVWKDKYAINTVIKDITSIKLNHVKAGEGVYSGLYVLANVDYATLKKVLMSDSFIEYIKVLKKYKSGGYYTYNSKDLEQYLNYKLGEYFLQKSQMYKTTNDK